jgi:DNA uptake protein ComE-like DNA-binding protein
MRMGLIVSALVVSALPIGFAGCNNTQSPTPEQVRQKTADATATLKEDAKALGEGVREGLTRPTPEKPIDLNHATKGQIMNLPGMDDGTADRIIAGRPYTSEHQLLERHIVSRDEYTKIADIVTVK